MQGIGLARQIHGFAFKKSELELGRQTVKKKKKKLYWDKCYGMLQKHKDEALGTGWEIQNTSKGVQCRIWSGTASKS